MSRPCHFLIPASEPSVCLSEASLCFCIGSHPLSHAEGSYSSNCSFSLFLSSIVRPFWAILMSLSTCCYFSHLKNNIKQNLSTLILLQMPSHFSAPVCNKTRLLERVVSAFFFEATPVRLSISALHQNSCCQGHQ